MSRGTQQARIIVSMPSILSQECRDYILALCGSWASELRSPCQHGNGFTHSQYYHGKDFAHRTISPVNTYIFIMNMAHDLNFEIFLRQGYIDTLGD